MGGSSLGVVSNEIPAQGTFLKNAWRFQALLVVFAFLCPFIYLYENQYVKYKRYMNYLEIIKSKGLKLNKDLNA